MKNINRYEIVDHGVWESDYFPGCGVSLTDFEECYTGIGNSYKEALDDAIDQACQMEWTHDNSELQNDLECADTTDQVTGIISEHYPNVEYTVRHVSYCGMESYSETFESLDDARTASAKVLSRLRREFPIVILERGTKWEVMERDDNAMVPDQCGILSITDNSDDVEKEIEHINDNHSNIFYYVSIRLRSKT